MNQHQAPDEPRAEPEIIAPGDPRAQWVDARGRFHRTERVYVGRVSPFGIALAMLVVAAIAGFGFLLLLGAFVILVPLVALLVAIVLFANLFRRWLR